MKEKLILRWPTIDDEKIVMEFKNEFNDIEELKFGSGCLGKYDIYNQWLETIEKYSKSSTVPVGRVPTTQFLTIRVGDGKLVGLVNIRHRLNTSLKIHGGHIGDCIRPTERHKGLGTQQIRLALLECKKLGIKKVLITCDEKA